MKKKLILVCVLIFLQNCGYTPIYSNNKKINFFLENGNFISNDREISIFIKNNLQNYYADNNKQKIVLNSNINYQKMSVSKNTAGDAEQYELSVIGSFSANFKNMEKKFEISEKFTINDIADEFEEMKYEKSIKKNLSELLVSKLLIELSTINVD